MIKLNKCGMKQENIKKLETRAVKLLGITIDNNLTYDKH